MKPTRSLKLALAVAALSSPLPAFAYDWSWTMNSPTQSCTIDACPWGNTINFAGAGTGVHSLTASAWSDTGNLGTTYNKYVEQAYLAVFTGGLGVKNKDASSTGCGGTGQPSCTTTSRTLVNDFNDGSSPEHAIDNNQRYDSVLLSFADSVKLKELSIGWMNTDADMTVLAYTGAGTATDWLKNGTNYNRTYGDLSAANGWNLIGHYLYDGSTTDAFAAADASGVRRAAINAGDVASKYWLVSAYNPTVGSSQGWTDYNDAVKLMAVAGNKYVPPPPPPGPQGVPEPGSLALAGLALAGLVGSRRRKP